jgi:phosphohistidine phosphatase
MLVGHLPHLSRLASLLLTGSADNAVINFKNSGFGCLERDEDNHWGITWILPPGILK